MFACSMHIWSRYVPEGTLARKKISILIHFSTSVSRCANYDSAFQACIFNGGAICCMWEELAGQLVGSATFPSLYRFQLPETLFSLYTAQVSQSVTMHIQYRGLSRGRRPTGCWARVGHEVRRQPPRQQGLRDRHEQQEVHAPLGAAS
uniref:Uncharacterized protein n=1 Tax=Pectinophora gossypiella TaxID=13191 RepID=A0A1E1WTK5_PECGO